jgi:small subunit ribosomal protein S15
MSKLKQKTEEIIKNLKKHEKDVGSPEVQITILTQEILNLSEHLKKHPKDYSSKKGLILKVVKRRKLLRYLKRTSEVTYKKIIKEMKI